MPFTVEWKDRAPAQMLCQPKEMLILSRGRGQGKKQSILWRKSCRIFPASLSIAIAVPLPSFQREWMQFDSILLVNAFVLFFIPPIKIEVFLTFRKNKKGYYPFLLFCLSTPLHHAHWEKYTWICFHFPFAWPTRSPSHGPAALRKPKKKEHAFALIV